MTLEEALAAHEADRPDRAERQRRDVESAAHLFVPDPESEAALRQRAKSPEAYDLAQRDMNVSGLDLALYENARESAIRAGTFHPDEETTR